MEINRLSTAKTLIAMLGASTLLSGCATYDAHIGARNGESHIYREPIRNHYGVQMPPKSLKLMHFDKKKEDY